jgi:hypothetical protein
MIRREIEEGFEVIGAVDPEISSGYAGGVELWP